MLFFEVLGSILSEPAIAIALHFERILSQQLNLDFETRLDAGSGFVQNIQFLAGVRVDRCVLDNWIEGHNWGNGWLPYVRIGTGAYYRRWFVWRGIVAHRGLLRVMLTVRIYDALCSGLEYVRLQAAWTMDLGPS